MADVARRTYIDVEELNFTPDDGTESTYKGVKSVAINMDIAIVRTAGDDNRIETVDKVGKPDITGSIVTSSFSTITGLIEADRGVLEFTGKIAGTSTRKTVTIKNAMFHGGASYGISKDNMGGATSPLQFSCSWDDDDTLATMIVEADVVS